MKYLRLKLYRDFGAQRWQFAAVFVTVFLGVLLFCASYDAYRNLTISYRHTYERLALADLTVSGAGQGFAGTVSRLDGVAATARRTQADVPLRVGDRILVGRVVGMPPGQQPSADKLDVVRGSYLPAAGGDTAVIETHMATYYHLQPGDHVDVLTTSGWRPFALGGEAVSAEYLWPARSNQMPFEAPGDFGVLFVPESVVGGLAAVSTQAQDLLVYAAGADRVSLDAQVSRAAQASGGVAVLQADLPSNKTLSLDLTGFGQMSVLFPLMFLLVAGLATYMLLTRVVATQRREIGTLRANGLSRSTVVRHYLWLGLVVGVAGAVVGVIVGVPAGWAITGSYTKQLGIPDTVRAFRIVTPVVGLIFGIAVSVLSAWVPARGAVKLGPAEAMRGDVAPSAGHPALLERLLPPLGRLPVRWRMVLRGIGRSRRRSLSSVIGVVLALVLVVTSSGLIDTTQILLARQYTQVERQDAVLVATVPVDATLVNTVSRVPGVAAAEAVTTLDISVKGPGRSYATRLMAFNPTTQMHGYELSAGHVPEAGLVAGSSLPDMIGAPLGSGLQVTVVGQGVAVTLPLDGLVKEPLGTLVYTTAPVLAAAMRRAGVTDAGALLTKPENAVVMVRFDPNVDRIQVLAGLRGVSGIAAVSDSRALFDLVQQYMGFFYVFVGVMLVFGGVMALALIFNTVSVNLAERAGELASMRANGVSRRQIAALVTAENLILTGLAIIPGLVVAYAVAAWFMSTYTNDMLHFNLELRPRTLVISAFAMFVATAVSLWPNLRVVGRVDVARVARERSA